MGRLPVSSRQDNPTPPAPVRVGLPLKIAGIVFWGLVAIGILLAAQAIHWMKNSLATNYRAVAHQATLSIRTIVDQNPDRSLEEIRPLLRQAIARQPIEAVKVERGVEAITIGQARRNATIYVDAGLSVRQKGQDLQRAPVVVTVFQPPLQQVLAQRKKNIMIAFGILFFAFGILLQWILQLLLTHPFLQMVQTAQAFSEGNEVRFNERRSDEFGYLARFINKALDKLGRRQRELAQALARARRSEQELAQAKEQLEVTLHSIAEGVLTTDREGRVTYLNPAAESLTGHRLVEARGRPLGAILALVDENDGLPVDSSVQDCLARQSVVRAEPGRLLRQADGREIAVRESAAPIHDNEGRCIGAVLVVEDVSETRELTRRLSYQASHDPLTGLANRTAFDRHLQQAMEEVKNEGTAMALCYLDLDQFKLINDTCGHIAGDELLRQLASILHQQVRESDLVARLGGDEFGILLHGCSLDDAEHIAQQIGRAVGGFRFTWEGRSFRLGVSIGVVPLDEETADLMQALSAADMACYEAKEKGRNCVHVYRPMDKDIRHRREEMDWVSRIREALAEDRFVLYGQPIVAVGGPSRTLHREVLLRLRDEDGHIVSPGAFLPAAERYGLMPDIDLWVLDHTLKALARSADEGNEVLAVNLSGQSMAKSHFLEDVVDRLAKADVDPARLCFEITETAAISNMEHAARFISILQGMGCCFALDDFGSGMSSFAYLKQLPVNYLKIDGSYVHDMDRNPVDHAMVEAVNSIGHAMGMQTIAEYVENEQILAALEALGVDFAQGFGIARPAPLAGATPALAREG